MSAPQPFGRHGSLSRRGLLRAGGLGLTGAGAALLFGCGRDAGAKPLPNEPLPPPEVTRIKLPAWEEGFWAAGANPCVIPLYVADPFFRDEGIDVEYVPGYAYDPWQERVADGTWDLTQDFAAGTIVGLERVPNLTILSGSTSGATKSSHTTASSRSLTCEASGLRCRSAATLSRPTMPSWSRS